MKLVTALLLSIFFCSTGYASAKKVEVEFRYNNTGIASASLYMDGQIVCPDLPIDRTQQNLQIYRVVCDSVDIVAGTHNFTLTAKLFGADSTESPGFGFEITLLKIKDFEVLP